MHFLIIFIAIFWWLGAGWAIVLFALLGIGRLLVRAINAIPENRPKYRSVAIKPVPVPKAKPLTPKDAGFIL